MWIFVNIFMENKYNNKNKFPLNVKLIIEKSYA